MGDDTAPEQPPPPFSVPQNPNPDSSAARTTFASYRERSRSLRSQNVVTLRISSSSAAAEKKPSTPTMETTAENPSSSSSSANTRDFECNICLDMASDPVVTPCGHLFCWPCLYQWIYLHSDSSECPVCKGEVRDTNIIPIYGRGESETLIESSDTVRSEIPGDGVRIPKRPHARRIERARVPEAQGSGDVLSRLRTLRDVLEGGRFRDYYTRRVRQRIAGRRTVMEPQPRNNGDPHEEGLGLGLGLGFELGLNDELGFNRFRTANEIEMTDPNEQDSAFRPRVRTRAFLRRHRTVSSSSAASTDSHWRASSGNSPGFVFDEDLDAQPSSMRERERERDLDPQRRSSMRERELDLQTFRERQTDRELELLVNRSELERRYRDREMNVSTNTRGRERERDMDVIARGRDFVSEVGEEFRGSPEFRGGRRTYDELTRSFIRSLDGDSPVLRRRNSRELAEGILGHEQQNDGIAGSSEEDDFLRRLSFLQQVRNEQTPTRRLMGAAAPILVDEVEERMARRLESSLAREQEEIYRYLTMIRRMRTARIAAIRARLASMEGMRESALAAAAHDGGASTEARIDGSSSSVPVELMNSIDSDFIPEDAAAVAEDVRDADNVVI